MLYILASITKPNVQHKEFAVDLIMYCFKIKAVNLDHC